ncbi:hypothetical protein MRY87_01815 [bacterium]|nr:hypothetical protein [bacterium]
MRRVVSSTVRLFALILGGCGAVLLGLLVYGALVPPAGELCHGESAGVPNYHCRTVRYEEAQRSLDELYDQGDEIPESEIARRLFQLVSSSFVHRSQSYRTRPWDNWYFWFRSVAAPTRFESELLVDSQDPVLLWKRGGGFCHQAAWIYVAHLRSLGVDARLLKLPNHYLAEVFEPGSGWRVVDVDLNIFWESSYEELMASSDAEQAIRNRIQEVGYGERKREKHVRAYLEGRSHPVRLQYLYDPELYAAEVQSRLFLWLFPMALLGGSSLLFWLSARIRSK